MLSNPSAAPRSSRAFHATPADPIRRQGEKTRSGLGMRIGMSFDIGVIMGMIKVTVISILPAAFYRGNHGLSLRSDIMATVIAAAMAVACSCATNLPWTKSFRSC